VVVVGTILLPFLRAFMRDLCGVVNKSVPSTGGPLYLNLGSMRGGENYKTRFRVLEVLPKSLGRADGHLRASEMPVSVNKYLRKLVAECAL
jgi:hypothetical protein